jgi:hypothetical protein
VLDLRSLLDGAVACTFALLAVPLARVALGPGADAVAYLGVFVGTFAVALAGARSARDLERSIAGWVAVATFVPPVAAFAWFVHSAVDAGVVLPASGVGSVAAASAGVAVLVASEIRLRDRTERATEYARFEARMAPRARNRFVAAFAVVGVGWLAVGIALVAVSGADEFGTFAASFGGLAGGLAALGAERDVRITDEGFRESRRFQEWESFESFEVTEDAVVLHRRGWRWSQRFDREDVDDPAAVERALGRFLQKRSR